MSERKYFNEKMATLSLDETHDVQEKALMKQLDYVWAKSPFYQKKFGEAGVARGGDKDAGRPGEASCNDEDGAAR